MVHAGVLPGWTTAQTLALAAEVEAVLRGPDMAGFLHQMYGNEPAALGRQPQRQGAAARDRQRADPAALLHGRRRHGIRDQGGRGRTPPGYLPWFDVPGRRTADVTVAFGHWSTLGWLGRRDVIALDSGCVWGGHLSAMPPGRRRRARTDSGEMPASPETGAREMTGDVTD